MSSEKLSTTLPSGDVTVCAKAANGISIAANKFKGIRAALVNSTYLARMTRRHNDANILCLGGRTIGDWEAIDILETFFIIAFIFSWYFNNNNSNNTRAVLLFIFAGYIFCFTGVVLGIRE